LELDEIQKKRTGDAQLVFVLLLSLARQIAQSNLVWTAAAIKRLSSESLNTGQDGHPSLYSNGETFFESQETQIN